MDSPQLLRVSPRTGGRIEEGAMGGTVLLPPRGVENGVGTEGVAQPAGGRSVKAAGGAGGVEGEGGVGEVVGEGRGVGGGRGEGGEGVAVGGGGAVHCHSDTRETKQIKRKTNNKS